ncbi:MAG TPA: SUMF1/EgtB/PvdO family nonheme iron enzyme [Phycisphaerae bacterium]|nr:SUMF1/EgtB/PvdO family nonheme iron enzyme [Phycisphaerae bacterium]HRY71202.1 SUMF1/EgtB/PvdO family nonheme iron enzyme [Phycisphaerae bacterium]HSA29585.1 SUMF1/EgtB/PvdO family nonheme iron enzyme [Phycisphaerae bacterium]
MRKIEEPLAGYGTRAIYFKVRNIAFESVVTTDTIALADPYAGMVLVPAGEFQMGDSFDEGSLSERPLHVVYIDAFYIDCYEVTKQQYADALNWGALTPRRPKAEGAHPMQTPLNRRQFLIAAAITPTAVSTLVRQSMGGAGQTAPQARLLFVSQGKTALVNADGTGLRYLEFTAPNQVTWQPAGFFRDGRRVLLLSMEPRRDGPGKPFEEYYTQTPTHVWIYDLNSGSLEEAATRDRMAVFYTPQLLLNNNRVLMQVCRKKAGQIFSMNLDGTDAREFTRAGEGLPYGLSLSPDGKRVAYHLAGPSGYQIWTSDIEGGNRIQIAGQPGHLYFGPAWSPDGRWLAYQDCHAGEDPGHDWSDICVSRPDGQEKRVLTEGQSMWFGATYGNPRNRGGGSNLVGWTHDGSILFPRRLPGSKVAWEFQDQRPDIDHFNRDYKPDLARGGTEICRLDPRDGSSTRLTHSDPPAWDFRAHESPDGRLIVFCRAATGDVPAIWVMGSDGRNPRQLTKGLDDRGADHPAWVPQAPGTR